MDWEGSGVGLDYMFVAMFVEQTWCFFKMFVFQSLLAPKEASATLTNRH